MAEKMTLEQALTEMLSCRGSDPDYVNEITRSTFDRWTEAINAHLSQPAQAVDVEREIACALAEADGFDPDDQHGGLYDLRWSGGPAPEPMGDAWTMDYLPKAEQIAKRITRAIGNAQARAWRVTVDPVAMEGSDEACQVWLRCGHQHFQVGDAHETREEGEWFAGQLRIALRLSPTPPKAEE